MATPRAPQQQQASGPRPRILRIGVLLGGKIVEERLIRERVPVTIGQSMKNTFSVPVEGLPLELTLFALDQNKYSLRFLNKMDGRLSDGAQVHTLDSLKGRGATNHGEYWEVPLSETSRGKLSLGDLTILFQFVTEPPVELAVGRQRMRSSSRKLTPPSVPPPASEPQRSQEWVPESVMPLSQVPSSITSSESQGLAPTVACVASPSR